MAGGSPLDLARDIDRAMSAMSRAVRQVTRDVAVEGGKAAKAEHLRLAGEAPGSDRRFSNFTKANHRGVLNVRVKIHLDGAVILPKGPWKLAEEGADAHNLDPGRHPGTRQGRKSWSRGKAQVFSTLDREIPKVADRELGRAWRA